MSIIVTYRESDNPEGAAIPGVPLRSLDAADLAALPAHLVRSIPLAAFYRVRDQEAFDAALKAAEQAQRPAELAAPPADEPPTPSIPRRAATAAPASQE